MKNKIFILSAFLFLLVLIFSCKEEEKAKSWREENAQELARLYPNESSELAWVMREMAAKTEELKTQLENGEEIQNLSNLFGQIHGAESMRAEAKTEAFGIMTQSLLNSFDDLQKAKGDEQLKAYYMMIQNCVVCHTAYCPGPLARINKLKINLAE